MRILIPVMAALLIAACGGEEGGASGADKQAEAREATLKFARCMREHGVDMPDPKVGEGGDVEVRIGGPNVGRPDPKKMEAAQEACQKHLEAIEPPKLSDEEKAKVREESLAHARCMREHGVDFPDPQFSEDGGAMVKIGPGSGLDPRSPKFQRAQKACAGKLRGPRDGGGAGATEEVSP